MEFLVINFSKHHSNSPLFEIFLLPNYGTGLTLPGTGIPTSSAASFQQTGGAFSLGFSEQPPMTLHVIRSMQQAESKVTGVDSEPYVLNALLRKPLCPRNYEFRMRMIRNTQYTNSLVMTCSMMRRTSIITCLVPVVPVLLHAGDLDLRATGKYR